MPSTPALSRLLFQAAHAVVRADFKTRPRLALTGTIDYTLRGEATDFALNEAELLSVTGVTTLDVLRSLGPFTVECYWFNRPQLAALPGLLGRDEVIKLQRQWAGGLMLYRDGFRVFPYGSPDDDWLDLDRKAFASGGYKVNRRQLIGRVTISSKDNPALVDQTNREGLRQRAEKDALVSLLKHILEAQFRAFLNRVDRDSALTLSTIEKKVGRERASINQTLAQIKSRYPQSASLVSEIALSVRRITGAVRDVKSLTTSLEDQRRQLVQLAGVGLMVEVVAHELGRATRQALKALPRISRGGTTGQESVRTLEQQLKTLEKRLRILDPLASTAHQVKEDFELVAWVREILDTHSDQFSRHHVTPKFSPDSVSEWPVRAVKGMVVQILENLIANSVYWLDRKRTLNGPTFHPEMDIVLDRRASEIRLRDNGPGIRPANRERVFEPFFTSKPPGEGKGLGLYIARELARYNGWDLTLIADADSSSNRLSTFVITVPKK
jgi:signal transduction histidine kinase